MTGGRPDAAQASGCSCLLAVVICSLIVGCGGGPEQYRVSGTVTFAGQPIPAGMIYFTPDSSKDNTGVPGFAVIKDGKYDTSAEGGQGAGGGAMIVRIEGNDGIISDDDSAVHPPLFPPYETTADIPKSRTTKDFDVPAEAAQAKPEQQPRTAPGV